MQSTGTIIGVLLIIFITIFIFAIKMFTSWKSNFWQIFYCSFVFISVFILFCFYIDFFIIDFLSDLGLRFSIRDPQDYLNLKIDFIIYYSLFFTIFWGLSLVWFYLWSYFYFFFKSLWLIVFFSFLTYYFGVDLIIRYDLFFSNWPDFRILNEIISVYNLTPDIFILILVYYSELYLLIDFIIFFLLLVWLKKNIIIKSFLNLNILKKLISKKYVSFQFKLKRLNLYGHIVGGLNLIYIFFTFGGESISRELTILLFFYLFLEVILFTFIFYYYLNLFKGTYS